jgi:hypothetical protein
LIDLRKIILLGFAFAEFSDSQAQKHAFPRRSIAVRFTSNKQTPTRRVRCDAIAAATIGVIILRFLTLRWAGDGAAERPGRL